MINKKLKIENLDTISTKFSLMRVSHNDMKIDIEFDGRNFLHQYQSLVPKPSVYWLFLFRIYIHIHIYHSFLLVCMHVCRCV